MAAVEITTKTGKDGVTITADFREDDGSSICRYRILVTEETAITARPLKFDLADHIVQFLKDDANAPWMKDRKNGR